MLSSALFLGVDFLHAIHGILNKVIRELLVWLQKLHSILLLISLRFGFLFPCAADEIYSIAENITEKKSFVAFFL